MINPKLNPKRILATLMLFLSTLISIGASIGTSYANDKGDKVVYHIDNSEIQATKALRNIRNHLDVAPETKIIVVAHAEGVQFLLEGAQDNKNNIDYAPLISALKARGVMFEVCELTLTRSNMDKKSFVLEADFTPSGVVRITQLQTREGYAYIKP